MSNSNNSDTLWIWIGSVIGGILIFVLVIYLIWKYMQGGQFRKNVRIDDKVVIVTGCNTGIGKETVLELARRGAKIYMACRDSNRCEEARKEIVEKTGNTNIYNRTLDLSSFESIREFAKKFLEEETRLDILINNAGIMMCPRTLTVDNFESQIGVNHLGHFLLTNLLLDTLKASEPSRIVVVSSMAHTNGEINKEDLNSEKSYDRLKAYCQSKLANILFTRHLAKMLEGTSVTVNCLHPGAVRTELLRHIHPILMFLGKPLVMLLFKSAVSGAQTTLCLALDPDLEKVSGKYFSDCKEKKPSTAARDDETAEWLWKTSEKLTKLEITKLK